MNERSSASIAKIAATSCSVPTSLMLNKNGVHSPKSALFHKQNIPFSMCGRGDLAKRQSKYEMSQVSGNFCAHYTLPCHTHILSSHL